MGSQPHLPGDPQLCVRLIKVMFLSMGYALSYGLLS